MAPVDKSYIYEGIPVNPILPRDFEACPNEERPKAQIDAWWGRPFIRTCTWEEMTDTYAAYRARTARLDTTSSKIMSEAEFNTALEERRKSWFDAWPTGTRYDVRCLDGGAWDRSTNWGSAPTLEEAAAIAKGGPAWRQR